MVVAKKGKLQGKTLNILMITSEEPSNCTGQGPVQNQLQIRKKITNNFLYNPLKHSGTQDFTLSYTGYSSTPKESFMFEIRKCNQN